MNDGAPNKLLSFLAYEIIVLFLFVAWMLNIAVFVFIPLNPPELWNHSGTENNQIAVHEVTLLSVRSPKQCESNLQIEMLPAQIIIEKPILDDRCGRRCGRCSLSSMLFVLSLF